MDVVSVFQYNGNSDIMDMHMKFVVSEIKRFAWKQIKDSITI